MDMKIDKEDLLRINRGFGGGLRTDASIDFAIEKQQDNKLGEYKKLAFLWRAILVDHPFSDGNKRTAVFLAFNFAEELDKRADRDLLVHHALSIAKSNITDINVIERRLRNAIN
jgi:prophage maintenance system killer protein